MEALIIYFLKSLICSGISIGYYFLVLRNRPFHRFNRFYLLNAVAISIVLPTLSIPLPWASISPGIFYAQRLEAVTIVPNKLSSARLLNYQALIIITYSFISILLLLRFIFTLIQIRRLRRKYTSVQYQGIQLYETDEHQAPFSFFRSIFWNRKMDLHSEKGKQVFRHEWYHTRQLHSLDLVFMEFLIIVAWLNPFYYLIRRELMITHEFSADEFAVRSTDPSQYAELLINNAAAKNNFGILTHQFFHSPLKRRITMIIKNAQPRRISLLTRLMSFVVLFILFCSFAFHSTNAAIISSQVGKTDTTPLTKVEFEPEFEGGAKGWQDFLIHNLQYPKEAEAQSKSGTVLITFVVNTDKTVQEATITKDPGYGLGEAALKVINFSSGKWNPAVDHGKAVRAYKIQPIIFKLDSSDTK